MAKALRSQSGRDVEEALSEDHFSNYLQTLMMEFAKKLIVFGLFVALAVIVAGVYGAVHDQISYTVSPEYFTKFKFQQFQLGGSPHVDRVRAAMVGFLASWWMGIPVGILVGLAGFIHRGTGQMLRMLLWSMFVAVVFTLLFGLAGLLYGYLQTEHIDLADYHGWSIPDDVTHLRGYLCAGYMHLFTRAGLDPPSMG